MSRFPHHATTLALGCIIASGGIANTAHAQENEYLLVTNPNADEYSPRVVHNAIRDEYLLSYKSSNGNTLGLRGLNADGQIIAALPHPFNAGIGNHAVLAHSPTSDRYLVATYYFDWFVLQGFFICRPLDGSGQPVGPVQTIFTGLADIGSLPHPDRLEGIDPFTITWNSDQDEFLFTAQGWWNGDWVVRSRRVSVDGQALGTAVNSSPTYNSVGGMTKVSVAYVPEQGGWYALAGLETITVLDTTGAYQSTVYLELDTYNVSGGQQSHDITYGGGQLYLAWDDRNNHDPNDASVEVTGIWSMILPAQGVYAGGVNTLAVPISSICMHYLWLLQPWAPQVAWDPASDQLLAVWRETPSNDPCNNGQTGMQIHMAVRGDIHPAYWTETEHFQISTGLGPYAFIEHTPLEPQIAVGHNGRVLVVWDDPRSGDRDIWAAMMQLTTTDSGSDLDNDGDVDVDDLLALFGPWGPCSGCPADLDGNGIVDIDDLLVMLSQYG